MKTISIIVLAALGLTAPAFAQSTYPDRAITLIAPFAAGGTSDALARSIAAELGEILGQPVLVENRPGAGGTVGLTEVARAPADGYTIGLAGVGSLVHSAGIYKSVIQFDAKADFAPIGLLGTAPVVAVASPTLEITDLAGLVEIAKTNAEMPYGTAGIGGAMHLAGEVFQREANVQLLHVPYAGVAPAVTEFLGGQIKLGFFDTTAVLPHMAGGKMNVLGIGSTERVPQLPDVSTFAEQGYGNVVVEIWYSLVAPAGTPASIVHALAAATSEAATRPAFNKILDKQGFLPLQTGAEPMAQLIYAELAKRLPIIDGNGHFHPITPSAPPLAVHLFLARRL